MESPVFREPLPTTDETLVVDPYQEFISLDEERHAAWDRAVEVIMEGARMEPLGKLAYDAYRQARQRALADKGSEEVLTLGRTEWQDLSSAERDAWQVAAEVVREA